jgi:malate/lactate dehydrogenase
LKIALVGAAGGIGSSAAYTMATRGIGTEYLLVDPNEPVLQTQVMDLEQLRIKRPFVVRVADLDELPTADIVVISAAVPPEPDRPRMHYLRGNLTITRQIAEVFDGHSDWQGVIIFASNPVDPLLLDFQVRTGIDRRRVIGYSINDTLRFRYGIALEARVRPDQVLAWVIGEHGNGCVPLFSRVEIDGAPVNFDEDQQRRIREYLLGWYPRWVALGTSRTSTWMSGNGLAEMVEHLIGGLNGPWLGAIVLEGEYGIDGVAMTVPLELGRSGVRSVLNWELSAPEQNQLKAAAGYLSALSHPPSYGR